LEIGAFFLDEPTFTDYAYIGDFIQHEYLPWPVRVIILIPELNECPLNRV
jgi:hypothetical protein